MVGTGPSPPDDEFTKITTSPIPQFVMADHFPLPPIALPFTRKGFTRFPLTLSEIRLFEPAPAGTRVE